ncbi:MAG TPA: V-type ATP synthase subunit I [Lachnospiraceae bacterium]
MAVLQMQKISICARKKDRKAILETLQAKGLMEIIKDSDYGEDFEHLDVAGQKSAFERNAHLADGALEILDKYLPEKKSMLSAMEGKPLLEQKRFQSLIKHYDKHMKDAKEIHYLDKLIAEKKAVILKMENQKEILAPWLGLDISMNHKGTKSLSLLIGTMGAEQTIESVYALLEKEEKIGPCDVTVISKDKDLLYLAVLCKRQEEGKVEAALRSKGFVRPSYVTRDIPKVKVEKLNQKIIKEEEKIKEAIDKLKSFAEVRQELEVTSDYYRMRAEKYGVLSTIAHTKHTFFIEGYVPRDKVDILMGELEKRFALAIEKEEIKEEEEVPVLLKNNTFSAPVESVLESYGLPKKGEVDPTTVMSVFYVFFFGMMLSDAAYGLIVALATGILVKKFPRMPRESKRALTLFFWCGISTLVWGLLFGGFFGDIIDVVAKNYFHSNFTMKALWFVPLKDPMKLLVYSMLFGVIHLFAGLAMKGYMQIKAKNYMDFFCDVVLWYMLLLGLILLLLPSNIFMSIAQTKIVFPQAIVILSKLLAIGGALGILLMSGRSSKNPGLRLALGAYDLYNITGWLSDVLSYSRLLALGLATGVIASVVNQMGSMLGSGIIGTIGFIVVFVVGHTLNLAINLLGAYVHTNRLQFVEFFGKFYEGGGRVFDPFEQNTKYVDIKEDIKS